MAKAGSELDLKRPGSKSRCGSRGSKTGEDQRDSNVRASVPVSSGHDKAGKHDAARLCRIIRDVVRAEAPKEEGG